MTINDKQKRIKSLDVRQCAGDAVIDSGREIIDQQERQFDFGERSDGTSFANDYIPFKAFGRTFHYYSLNWTGSFRRGLTITDDFRVESTDQKAPDISKAIGEELYGLTNESVSDVKPVVQANFIKIVNENI